ncbi:MAG: dihydroorotase [Candidatus Humimicrobiaceae bacterium]
MKYENLNSSKRENIIIRNGSVVNPQTGVMPKSDILILGGIVKEIKNNIEIKENIAIREINASGLYVCPGFIDMHVHLREPGNIAEEDIESGIKSALRGGITALACMPNTEPVLDSQHLIEYIKLKAEASDYNILPVASITKNIQGEKLSEFGLLLNSGAAAFSDDGNCVQNPKLMYEAMRYAAQFDALLILHEEDTSFSENGLVNEGYYSAMLGLEGIPNLSEDLIVARDIMLAQASGARLHITHVSSANTVKMIERAKKEQIKITCDTTSEHLFFNDSILMDYDTNFKIKPPIRSEADRKAIIEGLRNGTIDAIASDHAPHLSSEKNTSFKTASFGTIGLETLFKAGLTKLLFEENFSLDKIISLISLNPARILNIRDPLIEAGKIANIAIVDIGCEGIYNTSDIISKSKNSAFLKQSLKGEIIYTISNGKIMFRNEK